MFNPKIKDDETSKKSYKPPKTADEVEVDQAYISPTMSYQRLSGQGFLKKFVKEVRFF